VGGNCSIPDIIPHNRVETERVIPKLKLFLLENLVNVQNEKVIFTLKRVKYERLQEFQYGTEPVQTTTNNPTRRVRTINQWRTRDIRQVLNFSPGSSGYLAMVT